MSYNENLAARIRSHLKNIPEDITEKNMFGGLSFLYQGKMTVGIVKDDLAVRIISSKIDSELENNYVRLMDFTKRPMKEFVYVSSEGYKTEEQLLRYIKLGLEHAKSKL